jgi:hypothetical protein
MWVREISAAKRDAPYHRIDRLLDDAARDRAAIAERLFRRAVRTLPIRVIAADGRHCGAGSWTDPDLRLIRPADRDSSWCGRTTSSPAWVRTA